MKVTNLMLAFLIFAAASGQDINLLSKLRQVEADFYYKIADSLEFKGTRWLCTQPVRTVFTQVKYHKQTKVLTVEGFFLLGGSLADTATLGLSGASIFLLGLDQSEKIKTVFDLGETSDIYRHDSKTTIQGYFIRMFTLANDNVLLIGGPGIFGATAFKVGELLNAKN